MSYVRVVGKNSQPINLTLSSGGFTGSASLRVPLRYMQIDDYEHTPGYGRDWEQGFNDAVSGECVPPVLQPDNPHPYNAYNQGWRSGQEYLQVVADLQGGKE